MCKVSYLCNKMGTMLVTVGELRKAVRHSLVEARVKHEDKVLPPEKVAAMQAIADNPKAIMEAFTERREVTNGVGVFVALRTKHKWDDPGSPVQAAMISAKVTPGNVADMLKGNNGSPQASEAATEACVRKMAQHIIQRYRNAQIDIVTCAQSSKPMSQQLAEMVASVLPGATFIEKLVRKRLPAEIEINEPAFKDWARKYRNDGVHSQVDVDNLRAELEKEVDGIRRSGRIASKSMKSSYRKFIDLHTGGDSVSEAVGKHVLIIDDNVASSHSLLACKEALVKAGADEYEVKMAAGFDYNAKNRKDT